MVSVSRLQNNNLSKLLFFTIVAFNTIVRDFSFAYNLNVNFFFSPELRGADKGSFKKN